MDDNSPSSEGLFIIHALSIAETATTIEGIRQG